VKEKEYFKQFDIKFGSLALGNHQLKVEIGSAFFRKYKNDDIKDGDIRVDVVVERKETMTALKFDIQGYVVGVCDVCLEDLTIPISKQEVVILKTTGIAKESGDENIVFVGEKEFLYNIEQLMYECIVTSVPIRKTHQETGTEACNPDMLKWIAEAQNGSFLQEDERWRVLKNIKFE